MQRRLQAPRCIRLVASQFDSDTSDQVTSSRFCNLNVDFLLVSFFMKIIQTVNHGQIVSQHLSLLAPHRNPMSPPKLAADAPILQCRPSSGRKPSPSGRDETHFGRELCEPSGVRIGTRETLATDSCSTHRALSPRSDISKTIARSSAAQSAHRRVRCNRRCSCKALPFPARRVR